MNPKDENVLLKVVKRSVGLPTGKGCGCGSARPAAVEESAAPAEESQGGECGCAKDEEKEERPKEQGQ